MMIKTAFLFCFCFVIVITTHGFPMPEFCKDKSLVTNSYHWCLIRNQIKKDACKKIIYKKERSYDVVIPGVFVGDRKATKKLVKRGLIDRVISFGKCKKRYKNLRYLKFKSKDSPRTNILKRFDYIYNFIENKQNGVLIHCYKGHSRSPAIAIAYLIKKFSLSYAISQNYLKRQRPSIGPKPWFIFQLKNFERLNIAPSGFTFELKNYERENVKTIH